MNPVKKILWTAVPIVVMVILYIALGGWSRQTDLEKWNEVSEKTDEMADRLHTAEGDALTAWVDELFALLPAGQDEIAIERNYQGDWKQYLSDYESRTFTFADDELKAFAGRLVDEYGVQRLRVTGARVTLYIWNDTLFYTETPVPVTDTIHSYGDNWYHYSYPYEELF